MSHEYPVPPWEEEGGVRVVMVWDTAAIVVCTLWPLFAEAAARPATMKSRRVAGGKLRGFATKSDFPLREIRDENKKKNQGRRRAASR